MRATPAAAVRHYEALEAHARGDGLADPDQSCAPELVEAYVHLGRVEEAPARGRRRSRAKAAAKGQPWSLARAERALGICAPDGSRPRSTSSRRSTLHAATPDLFETARTELAFGAWLRRDRRRVEARPLLRVRAGDVRAARRRPVGRQGGGRSWRRPARRYAAARRTRWTS